MEMRNKVKAENMSFLDGVRAGMFTVPGDGDIDFGVEAEQDPAKANPFEYAKKARAYIREKAHI